MWKPPADSSKANSMMRRIRPPHSKSPRSGHPRIAEIGTAALHRFRANLTPDQLCGAKARSTGEPCRQIPAKGRKRCKFHGGATPKGDGMAGWHTPGFPDGLPTAAREASDIKVARRRKQRARVASMTPEERARYEEWHRSHEPGSAAARSMSRKNREGRRWLANILDGRPPEPTREAAKRDAGPKTSTTRVAKHRQSEKPEPIGSDGASDDLCALIAKCRDEAASAVARVAAASELLGLEGFGCSRDASAPRALSEMTAAEVYAARDQALTWLAELDGSACAGPDEVANVNRPPALGLFD
ncbi:HGGxSTG domain-containing protein [Methylobacterium komagatae]